MARQATNKNLQNAKRLKSDEFYTQLCDIERELQHYEGCFVDKVVYCNTDDPKDSNFFKFFKYNFRKLGLRKLIASCYKEQSRGLFSDLARGQAYYCVYEGSEETTKVGYFNGDGDFRSEECLSLLKQADIVVTNPPFSLFREFVAQIVAYQKDFLVIGNINAITYKEIFELIQGNRAWLGVNLGRGISGFIVPDYYEQYGSEVDINANGEKIISTNNCLWLTNLDLAQRRNDINLTKHYSGNEHCYPKYDNCDGINVNKTMDIPNDYPGLMGVPITFLHKYNPSQFEIVRFRKGDDGKDLCVNGKCPYFRILVKNKAPLISTIIPTNGQAPASASASSQNMQTGN